MMNDSSAEVSMICSTRRFGEFDPLFSRCRASRVDKPDLSKVDEIGYVDLVPGSGHGPGGWIDVATIEVFGKAIKR